MNDAYTYLTQKKIFSNSDYVVAAISGGPDSMALLSLLMRIREVKCINIVCAHVNHNSGRAGQYEEQKFVEKFCEENNVIFETMTIDKYSNDNFESEARNLRYSFFEELVNKYHAKYLFTAHHGDDLMETVLMRIVRGSTLRGYSGFQYETIKEKYSIIRPLINLTKEEIEKYNDENNIPYAIDQTNFDDIHTRNRYRKYILPKLKEEDNNVHLKFLKFSNLLNEAANYIDSETKKVFSSLYNNRVLNITLFLKQEKVIRKNILYNILEDVYGDSITLLNDNHIELIERMIDSKKANIIVSFPQYNILEKQYDKIIFKKGKNSESSVEYYFELNEDIKLSNGYEIKVLENSDITTNYICRLSKEDIKFPLYVRTRKNGDKMYVKNLNGQKKINDIFIDCKIAMEDRKNWPVVVDSNDVIVWLPGLKKSKFDKQISENYDIIIRYIKEEKNEK